VEEVDSDEVESDVDATGGVRVICEGVVDCDAKVACARQHTSAYVSTRQHTYNVEAAAGGITEGADGDAKHVACAAFIRPHTYNTGADCAEKKTSPVCFPLMPTSVEKREWWSPPPPSA
jgi:hypothetical protein